MGELVSQAEFARHRSVSRKTVTSWKAAGYLVLRDGKVDKADSDAVLDSRGKPGNGAAVTPPKGNDTDTYPREARKSPPAGRGRARLRALLDNIDLMTTAEAEQVKANYLALQRRLEYEQAAGDLVPVAQAAQRVAGEYAAVRSKLLSLPTELAPQIAQENGGNANQIRERLAEGITRALEELTDDAGSDGS